MDIKSLTIYCSSSEKLDQKFYDLAEKIGFFFRSKSNNRNLRWWKYWINGKTFECCIKKRFKCNWRNP